MYVERYRNMFEEMKDIKKTYDKMKDKSMSESDWELLYSLLYSKLNSVINEFEECKDNYIKSDIEQAYKDYLKLFVKVNELYKNSKKD